MSSIGQKINDYLIEKLWDKNLKTPGKSWTLPIKLLRLAYIIFKGLTNEHLAMRAMSLGYTTLLTFVPLLAVSFSILKAFGVHTRIVIFLYYFLEPLGPKGVDLSMKIIEFVENVNISVLGFIGITILIYTVLSTIQKIESSLNYIWHIKDTRSFSQRFSNYMSVLLVGPVLIFSALGITASFMSSAFVEKLMSVEVFGVIFYFLGRVLPYVLICTAFTFIYFSLPHTKVRFSSALDGGIAAALLWQTTGWIFTSFVVSSAKYSAIYSGFATLVLFLIWLYWSFLILLVGAKVSFYKQHPQFIDTGKNAFIIGNRLKESTALMVMFLIGYHFYYKKHHWTFASLTERLGLPAEFVHDVITALEEKGLILSSGDEPPAFLPAKDIEIISLREVVDSVRISGVNFHVSDSEHLSLPEVDRIMKLMDDATDNSLEKETLKKLIVSGER